MLMVVFGAGASYDSNPSRRPGHSPAAELHRPPLANDLFGDRELFADAIRLFPRCHPIIPNLRHTGGRTVESVLQGFQAEASEYPPRYRQLAAVRYYLHYMLWECETRWKDEAKGVTNYKSLLDQIERRRKPKELVCLVTFNYDTLLEDALPDIGLTIQGLPDYINGHPHYKLFKLHGSVNWARQVETRIEYHNPAAPWTVVHEHIERAADLEVSQRYVRVAQHPCGTEGGVGVFPAVAIPVETKSDFECPSEHLEALRKLLPRVTKLLLIGWRATEEHFLELLKAHLRPLEDVMVVAGSERGTEEPIARLQQKLNAAGIVPRYHKSKSGFTDFIVNREGDGLFAIDYRVPGENRA